MGRIQITSLEELVTAVRDAAAAGHKVRAGGSGHSFSDVAVSDDVMLDLHRMSRKLELDRMGLLPGVGERHFVEVESGMRIRELNRRLEASKLARYNMGAYDGQTISGAIATGTHGSGHNLGALCDAVRSLLLVTESGEKLRIEPKLGAITDPERHAERHGHEAMLVQDDDLFYSAVVAMGCMGVVYSYILEVRERFLLAEHRELVKWTVLKEKLRRHDFAPMEKKWAGVPVRHFEFLVNPIPGEEPNRTTVSSPTAGRSRRARRTEPSGPETRSPRSSPGFES